MKISAIISFLLISALFSTTAIAQLGYYGADINLDSKGKSSVKLTFTFENPEEYLNFTVLGNIENFEVKSMAGLVNCSVTGTGVSYVSCELPLTKEKRTVDISYETLDFTKTLGKKFLFSGDFTINQEINQFHLSLKLPEGMGLSDEGKLSFPDNATKISDGRSIIIIWKLDNVNNQPLVFQTLYEPVIKPSSFLWYFIGGTVIASAAAFFIIRRIRKPEEVIFSVLDDYEKNIMKAISQAGGEINQRKVVQETNLSKAKVSRVVKTLAERGLIEIKRSGRTNKLKMVKKKIFT